VVLLALEQATTVRGFELAALREDAPVRVRITPRVASRVEACQSTRVVPVVVRERPPHGGGHRAARLIDVIQDRARATEPTMPLGVRRPGPGAFGLRDDVIAERAGAPEVQQAYVTGVSTRKVDQLVESLGLRISRSEVSRISAGLDEQVEVLRSRPLEGRYPYLFVDGKVEKLRAGGRVVRKCVVIAHGVHETGRREIVGLDVGGAETEAFWREFLRGLVARGLVGVELAISDAHPGLKAAIAQVLACPWQRCTVHFLRDCLGHARKDQHGLLAALIRPVFGAANRGAARAALSQAVAALEGKLPKVAAMLEEAEEDVLPFYAFPPDHWRKLRSTNPLERLNREIGRRTDVVGIFPDDASLVRLATMLCIEQNDEWLVGRRYLSKARR
jgi:putative transposase